MTAPAVLVHVAHAGDHLADSTLEALTLARGLGEPIAVATSPPSPRALDQLATAGIDRVIVAGLDPDRALLAPAVGQVLARAVEHVGGGAGASVLIPASFFGKEVAAHTAHLLGAGLLIDVADVRRTPTGLAGGKRAFAGSWVCDCETTTPLAVVTIRPNAVAARAAERPGTPVLESLAVEVDLPAGLEVIERTVHSGSGRPDLAEATHVVAGGRGTYGDFAPVEELADALGGAVGTTRDCVEEGWISHDLQIGQTGVTIAPRVYIGAGISGAPHHHGGMQASSVVIAVNIDEEAPLVQICDFAVIGDAGSVLSEAAEVIRAHRYAEPPTGI
ncbi:electron transfer flavoprotein subunit alpha/FixB family protein [Pseudactinotalea sp. HY158]|uniref:electron transfer flavoprotein subunit alpha/FixB family protein n=1 Tax=Pseudactinotalea sp. HY158 TaxID=2654547 RepID=UPI00129C36F8|nr:electron transfer flavoprotein subunit alpha/FixB family protein [Pseudactinotalea sp. HY158]QGH68920.1 electron transfer flavoprotein subunit alpha/FixB family protein [Pseudactinotalea sp. HY158]